MVVIIMCTLDYTRKHPKRIITTRIVFGSLKIGATTKDKPIQRNCYTDKWKLKRNQKRRNDDPICFLKFKFGD